MSKIGKLYHYVHCPFCVRVRMALGYLNLEYVSVVLPYNDEETPISLTGVKMLPVFEFNNSEAINESLDIIKRLDSNDELGLSLLSDKLDNLNSLLDRLGKNVHSLAMPYWIYTPEFKDDSREYFVNKKSQKRGPFHLLVQNAQEYLAPLQKDLNLLENDINGFYKSQKFSIIDIMLASHLWGLYVVPEFQFSTKLHQYLMDVKKATNFNYHEDHWKQDGDFSKMYKL